MALLLYKVQRVEPTKKLLSNYESSRSINLSGVPEQENFSEQIDTIFIDELGIKNVRFKQTF
jgi:hypothetical protein